MVKRCVPHMQGPQDISNTISALGKIRRLVKGNQEEGPQRHDSSHTTRVRLSVSEPTHVSIHTYCTLFPPPNKHLFNYFPSLWEFFSAKPKTQGLVTDHWPSSEDSVFSQPRLGLNFWWGNQAPLQAAAGQGLSRSQSYVMFIPRGLNAFS